MAELTEGIVKEIGEWIKFYIEHVTELEWIIEARWKRWDVSYRISLESSSFVHITPHWDSWRNQTLRIYALHAISSLLFCFERYQEMESLGIIELSEDGE